MEVVGFLAVLDEATVGFRSLIHALLAADVLAVFLPQAEIVPSVAGLVRRM